MSSANSKDENRIIYLEELLVETTTKAQFRVKLQMSGNDVKTQHEEQTSIWTPVRSLEVTHASNIAVIIKAGRTVAGISFGKLESRVDISYQQAMEAFWQSRELVSNTTFENQPVTVTIKIRPSHTLETTRKHLARVQDDMKKYKPMMEDSTEQQIDTFIKYGVVLAELNPLSKMAFGLVKVTFDLLKEQNKYDEMVSDLVASIERILPFAERTLDDVLYDEAELLEPLVRKLYDLIAETATSICEYIKQSPTNRLLKSQTLLEDRKMINNLQGDFKKLREDLDLAVSGVTLTTVSNIEKDLLLKRLKPIDQANYQTDRGCMEGTRTAIINDIITWAIHPSETDALSPNSNVDNVLWVRGMPGIGKTALANSICRQLHDRKNLGGTFFCRRDDPVLAESKQVLPTLVYRLAGMFGPYRNIVAKTLRDDPQLTPDSSSGEILLKALESLKKHPLRTLVLVIDAFDECGTPRTRRLLLNSLLNACKRVSWLKLIITSRPERDIQSSLEASRVTSRDLGEDDQFSEDIRYFTEKRLVELVESSRLPSDWPGEARRSKIIIRSRGLFIYVETLIRLLSAYKDPDVPLDRVLGGQLEEDNAELYKLYSTAVVSRVGKEADKFRAIGRAIIAVAQYRSLCDETLATLLGEKPHVVKAWVDDLSSILYRDESQNGGIRVRHLSILEFLTGSSCPPEIRIDMRQANMELSCYCLTTMTKELNFNMCELDTSCLPNSDVKDIVGRVQRMISDALQYSCYHWSSHLCSDLGEATEEINRLLEKFFAEAQPLYWLEVLSVMGNVSAAIPALRQIKECGKTFEKKMRLRVEDMLRFALAFLTPISVSAPHIYLSALPFMPIESDLWQCIYMLFPKTLNVCEGRSKNWPARPGKWHGHLFYVTCVAYFPNGQRVVSGSWDTTIRIWDTETGVTVGEPLKGHTDIVTSVACSPDNRYIVSGSTDQTVRIWDLELGVAVGVPLRGHTNQVTCVAYSPNGQYVASGSYDDTIRIWNVMTGAVVGEPLTGHTDTICSIAYSPDGSYIASGSYDRTVRLWDTTTCKEMGKPLIGHTDWVNGVIYSPDGRHIASTSGDRTIRIWDAATGTMVGEPLEGHNDRASSIAYSPNGQFIVSGSVDCTIRVWDVKTGLVVGEPLWGHTSAVNSVAYSPDGQHIVSGSNDFTVRMWDTTTGVAVGEPLEGHTNLVYSVAYSPNDQHVVSGSADSQIRIWDVKTCAEVGEPLQGYTSVCSVTYSPNGQHIAAGLGDNTVRIWDATTGSAVGEPLTGHTNWVNTISYSPNGQHIVSGSDDNTIRIWDVTTSAVVGEPLKEHTDRVTSVTYSPDGHHIASGSRDYTIRIWDATTGQAVGEPLMGHTLEVDSIAYSPNGQHIVSGSDDYTVRIWDVATGVAVGEPLTGHTDWVTSVTYSPNGQYIISGSYDRTIRIWSAATGFALGEPLVGHTDRVKSVTCSSDSRCIVSGSSDFTIRIWSLEIGDDVGEALKEHTDLITSETCSPVSREVMTTSTNDEIPTWDPKPTSALANGLSSRLKDLSSGAFENLSFASIASTPNAPSSFFLAKELVDPDGWVRNGKDLLFWVPEDCRNGLTSPAIRTIPNKGRHRPVRLNFDNFRYGSAWANVRGDI